MVIDMLTTLECFATYFTIIAVSLNITWPSGNFWNWNILESSPDTKTEENNVHQRPN